MSLAFHTGGTLLRVFTENLTPPHMFSQRTSHRRVKGLPQDFFPQKSCSSYAESRLSEVLSLCSVTLASVVMLPVNLRQKH